MNTFLHAVESSDFGTGIHSHHHQTDWQVYLQDLAGDVSRSSSGDTDW